MRVPENPLLFGETCLKSWAATFAAPSCRVDLGPSHWLWILLCSKWFEAPGRLRFTRESQVSGFHDLAPQCLNSLFHQVQRKKIQKHQLVVKLSCLQNDLLIFPEWPSVVGLEDRAWHLGPFKSCSLGLQSLVFVRWKDWCGSRKRNRSYFCHGELVCEPRTCAWHYRINCK